MSETALAPVPPAEPAAPVSDPDKVPLHRINTDRLIAADREAAIDKRHARLMQLIGGLMGAAIVIGGAVTLGHYVAKDASRRLLEIAGYLATGLGGWLFRGIAERKAELPALPPRQGT